MIVSEKAKAKINLALSVVGVAEGYHMLDSALVTVDLFDRLLVRSRKDKKITLKTHGLTLEQYDVYVPKKDNAFKAARAYCESTGSFGADITLYKNIPWSSGMGGSSGAAAAVLRAMERLYKKGANLTELANSLGSDTAYLLNGGACRLRGRGDIITPFNLKNDIYFSVAFAPRGLDTGECFKFFDEQNPQLKNFSSADFYGEYLAESADNGPIAAHICGLERGEIDYSLIKNDLYFASSSLCSDIKLAFEAYADLSPKAVCMTGAGSAVFAVFETRELCDWATAKMKKRGFNAVTLKTDV